MKKYFNVYTLLISGVVIIIITAFAMVFIGKKRITHSGIEIVSSRIKQDESITEEQAKELAVKQFKVLGEATNADNLNITKIKRKEEEYYFISSKENTLEIKILGGQITRINSILVDNM